MELTSAQVKGKIKSLANKTKADARLLMRIYMMDRFLERLSISEYKDNFIIKGGILVTSMIGVSMRSTMDIDASIRNMNLSEEDALEVIGKISQIQIGDGISFEVKKASQIMDSFEYPGIRIEMNAVMGGMLTPIKIDISTGDVITPKEIEYSYNLLIDDRKISLWTYNIETVLAEKLQTILARDIFNTRMRDFYDIFMLTQLYQDEIEKAVLKDAFIATAKKRNSAFSNVDEQLQKIADNENIQKLWGQYQKKFIYAADIGFKDVVDSVKRLALIACN